MTVPGTFARAAASTLAFVSPVSAVSPAPGPPPGAPGGACWFVGAAGVVVDPLPAALAIAAPAAPAAAVAAMIAVSLVGSWDMRRSLPMPLSPRRNHSLAHAGQELLGQLGVVDGAREGGRAAHRAERDDGVAAAAEQVPQEREVAPHPRLELRADPLVAARGVRTQAGD